ncbi:MAG TPA: glycosyltransferase family 39 protein [Thermomicrobiales bacterium]|nr:glycosyltransferase family 39 protein [Thermomicrobiales bacterium]
MPEPASAEVIDIERVRSDPETGTAPDTLESSNPRPFGGMAATTRIVVAIIALTLIKQLVLVLAYPPFQGHDEVAHVGYLGTIANEGRLPTFSDRLPAALEEFSRFTLDWPALYTANHPPLFYLISLPAYELAGGSYEAQLYAVRLMSVPLFLITIWLTYQIARLLFPASNLVTLGAPAVVAFQPQLGFEGAIVNNDMLAIMLGTLLLYLCLRAIRQGLSLQLALMIGLACGLGLLTKATLLALLPIVAGVALWCRWPRPWAQVRDARWLRGSALRALAIVGPTVTLALPWYIYLRRTYGDFTAFEATKELQGDWNRPAGTFTELLFSASFHEERVHETWGYFGWRLIPLDSGQLAVIYAAIALSGIGLLVGLLRWLHGGNVRPLVANGTSRQQQIVGVVTLAAASVLMYGAMVYFGTMFLLTQARYYFPILPAAIVLATAGLAALVPSRWQRPATVVLVGGAGLFQTLILVKMVLPYAYL